MNNLDRPTSSECSICFTEFSHPKQIPCLHSFCLKCLIHYCQGKAEGEVMPCPLCRREFSIPEGGVDKFSDDIDIVQTSRSRKERKCELCLEVEEDIKAESFCQNCEQFLCSRCRIRHLKQNVSKLHNIVSIEEKLKDVELQRAKYDYCVVHESEEFKLYCCDCAEMLCSICHATGHYTHKSQLLSVVVSEKRNMVHKQIEALEKRRNEVLGTMKTLDQAKVDCIDMMPEIKRVLTAALSTCREFHEHHGQYLLSKLCEIFSLKKQQIENEREKERLHYEELDRSINKGKTVLKIGTEGEIIKIADELHHGAESMSAIQDDQNSNLADERSSEASVSHDITEETLDDKMGKLLYSIKMSDSAWTDLVGALSATNHAEALTNTRKILNQLNSDVEVVKDESFRVAPQLVVEQKSYQEVIALGEEMTAELGELKSELSKCKQKLANQETTQTEHKSELQAVTEDRDQLTEKVCQLAKMLNKKTEDHIRLKSFFGSLRILIVVGLDSGDSVEPKICHINLDRPETINIINYIPFKIYNESAACVIDNVMYIAGVGTWRNELWKRIPEKDEWKKLAFLPAGRRGHCTTFVDDKIYVLGGYSDYEKRTLDSVLRYDITTNTWTQVTQLCNAVRYAACVTYKHFLYMFGGLGQDDKRVNYVQIYNTLTSEITLGSKPMPRIQAYMRAVLWETKVLLIGHGTCYIYDIQLNTWENRQRFKTDHLHFGLTLNDDILYISGGGQGKRVHNALVWPIRYDLAPKEVWTCTDEVKCLSVDDFISDNPQADWKLHAKLPKPVLVHSFNTLPVFRYI